MLISWLNFFLPIMLWLLIYLLAVDKLIVILDLDENYITVFRSLSTSSFGIQLTGMDICVVCKMTDHEGQDVK